MTLHEIPRERSFSKLKPRPTPACGGLGFESALLPAGALEGYAILFFTLAAWRLSAAEEK
jgi:hypothetical protein